jgi:hypothetical protein
VWKDKEKAKTTLETESIQFLSESVPPNLQRPVARLAGRVIWAAPPQVQPEPLGNDFGSKLVAFRANWAVFADLADS